MRYIIIFCFFITMITAPAFCQSLYMHPEHNVCYGEFKQHEKEIAFSIFIDLLYKHNAINPGITNKEVYDDLNMKLHKRDNLMIKNITIRGTDGINLHLTYSFERGNYSIQSNDDSDCSMK